MVTGENEQQNKEPHVHHTKRDAETQTALGLFISLLSVLVLIGTFWADSVRAMLVNAAAGAVLLGIGVAMIVWGRITSKKVS